MIVHTISKAPRTAVIEYLQGKRTRENIDQINGEALREYTDLFDAIQSEHYNYAYWDDMPVISQSRTSSFLRHLLTRSPKKENSVQLTTFQVKQGELIPLSDLQITEPVELYKAAPNSAQLNIFA